MTILRALGRFLVYSLVLLWAPAWLAAWWLWPPAPRSGWQIPADERCLGFLSDSRHVLTEEVTGDGKERRATGAVHVHNVDDGDVHASYTSKKGVSRMLDGDLLFEMTGLDEAPIKYPPGDGASQVSLCDVLVRDAWTGDVIFEDGRVHWRTLPVCRDVGIVAYVRATDFPGEPEAIWRDAKTGAIKRTFPGLAAPLDFSPSGRRFLAARWDPGSKLHYTLLLMDVPAGEILRSMQVPCQHDWTFMAQVSGNDRDALVQGDVYDFESGQIVFGGGDRLRRTSVLTVSRDGRYVISHDSPERALVWRSIASGQEEISLALGPTDASGSLRWMGWMSGRDFKWVQVGIIYQAQWPWAHRLPWLANWLPEQPKRTHFIVADSYSGRVVAQGSGHQPRFVSPDGQLLVMEEEEIESGRELLWNIPFDAGLPWPIAMGAGLSLPALVLWQRRRCRRARPEGERGT